MRAVPEGEVVTDLAVDVEPVRVRERTLVAVRGAKMTGVYQHNSTAQEAGSVMVTGVTKMAAGDSSAMDNAITAGLRVVASSIGQAVPSTVAGQHVVGIALEPLTTGSTGIIAVLLTPGAIST